MTHRPEVMRIRAQGILSECIDARQDVTHATLQGICRRMYAHDTPYIEREEIITQAMELYVTQKRGESPAAGKLTTAEVRMHARDFFAKDPNASSPEAWEYVKSLGEPSIRFTTFQNGVCVDVRAELGIKGPKGGGRRRRQRGTVGKLERKKRTPKPPAEKRLADDETGTVGVEATRAVTSATLTDAALRAAQEAGLADDDRDRITLETPGGRLTARHEGADTWLVEFRGSVPAEVVHILLADLIGPFTGRKEAMAS